MLDATLLERVVEGVPSDLVDEVIVAGGYKVDMIKDQIVQINEWKANTSFDNVEPVNVDTGFVHIEKNELTPSMIKDAEDAVVLLEQKLSEFESRLKEIEDAERLNQ